MLSSSQLVLLATAVVVSTVSAAYHAYPPHVSPAPHITDCFTLEGRLADGKVVGHFIDIDRGLVDLYPTLHNDSSGATLLGIDAASSDLVAYDASDFLKGYIATAQNFRGNILMRFERPDQASGPSIKCRLSASAKLACAVSDKPDLRVVRFCRQQGVTDDDPYFILGNSSSLLEGWDCEAVTLKATVATGCSSSISTIPTSKPTTATSKPSRTAKTTSKTKTTVTSKPSPTTEATSKTTTVTSKPSPTTKTTPSTPRTSTITTLPTSTAGPQQEFVCPSGSPTLCADGFLVNCSDQAINSGVKWYVYSNTISELQCHQACVLDPTCTGYYSYDEEIDLTLCQHTNDTFSPNTRFRFQYYFYTTGVRGFCK